MRYKTLAEFFSSSLSLFDFSILRTVVWNYNLQCCYIGIRFPKNGCSKNRKNTPSFTIRICAKWKKKMFFQKNGYYRFALTLKKWIDWINTRRLKPQKFTFWENRRLEKIYFALHVYFPKFFLKTKIGSAERVVKLISRFRNTNDIGMCVWSIHYRIKYLKKI